MKKILALLLALVFVFSFTACKNDEESASSASSVEDRSNDIKEAVLKGSIPELRLSLGTSIDDLADYYDEVEAEISENHVDGDGHVHGSGDIYLNITRGDLSVTYEIGTEKYYYEKAKKDNGIAVISSFDDAFGFKQGTSKSDIEARLSGLNITSLQAGEDELYFVYLTEALILRYKEGDYQLDFYFSDNQLVATVLIDAKNWTI